MIPFLDRVDDAWASAGDGDPLAAGGVPGDAPGAGVDLHRQRAELPVVGMSNCSWPAKLSWFQVDFSAFGVSMIGTFWPIVRKACTRVGAGGGGTAAPCASA